VPAAGFVVGLLTGFLGVGGGFLIVPALVLLGGLAIHRAVGTSLLVVGLIASSAVVPYALHRQVEWRNVAWFGLPGMLGAWLGATLAHWVPGAVQLALFAVVMLVAAWRMLRGAAMQRLEHEPRRTAVVAGGFAVGALSGLVGVGGGFLIVPALVLLAGVPMVNAVGTSLAVIALNSFTGFVKYLGVLERQSLALDWGVLAAVAAVGIVGSLAGHRLGRRLPQAKLRRGFGAFLLVMGLVIAVDTGPRLLH
jgi:hypothetical protein